MDHLIKKGYRIIGSVSLMQFLQQSNPRQVVGIMCDGAAPKGYVPGKSDDMRKGYGPGSEIITLDGHVYKCVAAETGKAVWIKLHGVPTEEQSAEPEAVAPEPEETPEVKTTEPEVEETDESKVDPPEEPVGDSSDGEPEQAEEIEPETQPEPKTVETGLDDKAPDFTFNDPRFEDMPYRTRLQQAKINDIYNLTAVVESGKLADVPHLNANRAKNLIEWLTENGHI